METKSPQLHFSVLRLMIWAGYGMTAINKVTQLPRTLLRDIADLGHWSERKEAKDTYRALWIQIKPQWTSENYDVCEKWFAEKGLMVPPSDEILQFATGQIKHLPKKVTESGEMAIPGIHDLFLMAKESGCAEMDVFRELSTMLHANAVVNIGSKSVDYIPIPESPEYDGEFLIISDMRFPKNAVVPDLTRRMKALDHLTRTLGMSLRDRAALIEADEKAKASADDREIKREALNLKKKGQGERKIIPITLGKR